MRTTQRVEEFHHLLKNVNIHSKTPLVQLFEVIDEKVEGEFAYEIKSEAQEQAKANVIVFENTVSNRTFSHVIQLNDEYLTLFIRKEMKQEMDESFAFRSNSVQFDDDLGARLSRTDDKNPSELDDMDVRLRISVGTLFSRIDRSNIEVVFQVVNTLEDGPTEYVILLEDGARWFKNEWQDDAEFDAKIGALHYVTTSNHFRVSRTSLKRVAGAAIESVQRVRDLALAHAKIPRLSKKEMSQKSRYTAILSKAKEIAEESSRDVGLYHKNIANLSELTNRESPIGDALVHDGIRDPVEVKTKGAPRKTRIKAGSERRKQRSNRSTRSAAAS
ncbi:hypothetical protein BGX21_003617 [Mortierella sp. AD011]|nr:hypothetical protein BGX21_003617 [Mortierella sp. AD011]